jgi:hypothetical protein
LKNLKLILFNLLQKILNKLKNLFTLEKNQFFTKQVQADNYLIKMNKSLNILETITLRLKIFSLKAYKLIKILFKIQTQVKTNI